MEHVVKTEIKQVKETENVETTETPESPDNIDVKEKNKYCFAFYTTNSNYACSVKLNIYHVMKNSDRLDFDIIIYVSRNFIFNDFETFNPKDYNSQWNGSFTIKSGIGDVPTPSTDHYKWTFIKILPFRETEYERLIIMDADTIGPLKDLTHLFLLPPTISLAAPVAYWENELSFTSALMSIRPSLEIFNTIISLASTDEKRNTEQHCLNHYFRPLSKGGFYVIQDMILLPPQYLTLTHSINKNQSMNPNPEFMGPPILAYENSILIHFSEGSKPWKIKRREEYEGDVFNEWLRLAVEVCDWDVAEVEGNMFYYPRIVFL